VGEPLTRIILDTDLAMGAPGSDIDDGFALALAVGDPGLSLELVTTVGGNTDVDTATRLSSELLGLLGRSDVPVVRGSSGPLNPRLRRADRSHAAPGTAAPGTAAPGPYAAAEIVARVMAEPGELTLVAIGPLTNVALALLLEPRLASAVREIVVMGGVFLEQTNVAGMPGEFNFWCDPEAVEVVLHSGASLRLVGLDVTRRVRLSRADAARLGADGGEFGRLAAEYTEGWIALQERVKPREELEQGSCALHDPLAVAVVTRPDLVTWQEAHVAVETAGVVARGVAVADLLMWEDPPPPNCRIATAVDADAFRAMFVERMAGLP
jgi:purine nucleosidase